MVLKNKNNLVSPVSLLACFCINLSSNIETNIIAKIHDGELWLDNLYLAKNLVYACVCVLYCSHHLFGSPHSLIYYAILKIIPLGSTLRPYNKHYHYVKLYCGQFGINYIKL